MPLSPDQVVRVVFIEPIREFPARYYTVRRAIVYLMKLEGVGADVGNAKLFAAGKFYKWRSVAAEIDAA